MSFLKVAIMIEYKYINMKIKYLLYIIFVELKKYEKNIIKNIILANINFGKSKFINKKKLIR